MLKSLFSFMEIDPKAIRIELGVSTKRESNSRPPGATHKGGFLFWQSRAVVEFWVFQRAIRSIEGQFPGRKIERALRLFLAIRNSFLLPLGIAILAATTKRRIIAVDDPGHDAVSVCPLP